MKYRCGAALVLLFAFAAPSSAEEGEWITLFDGGSLDAWRGYQKESVPESWVVEGDALTFKGSGGNLITREQYADFELRLEWKISKEGNSGVIYRATEEGDEPYQTGPEYQLLDNDAHRENGSPLNWTGALYGLYAADAEPLPVGEWNTTRIVVSGDRVEHWLNGERVVDCEMGSDDWNDKVAGTKFANWSGFAKHRRGHIALQDHGHPVWFRNIKIRLLEGDALPVTRSDARRASPAADRPARILFVTQSAGYRHSTVTRKETDLSHAERTMKQLAASSGEFRVDCTQDVENDFKPELIENYDIVMFFTTGKMFKEDQRLPIPRETLDWFLNDWLKQPGHGFFGVHSAADTYEDYEPYWDMIGGSFNGHPWTSNTTVTITVHEPTHPAAKPWGDEFVITDEIYQFKHWQPEKVRVLMSLNMAKTELKKPYHVPVLWVKQYGQGRAMHMSLGHREDVWSNPKYQESLLGGVRWLLGREAGDATPNPELSEAEDAKAKAVVEAKEAA